MPDVLLESLAEGLPEAVFELVFECFWGGIEAIGRNDKPGLPPGNTGDESSEKPLELLPPDSSP